MLAEAGWRIQGVKTARARKRLKWAGLTTLITVPAGGVLPNAERTAA
jgi:hypothetical protein